MNTNTKDIILQEFAHRKGELVLNQSHKVSQLVGIGEDDFDYYYIMYDGRRLNWESCVGRFIPLKGQLCEKDYNYLRRIADLNYMDKVLLRTPTENYSREEYIEKLKRDINVGDVLLTDLVFDEES